MKSYNSLHYIHMILLLSLCSKLSNASPLYNQNRSPRLSIAEWDQYNERDVQGPGTYAFGYDVQSPETDNIHFRNEERLPNGTVIGSYGFVSPDGDAHVVKYVADHLGYRATVETTRRLADVKPIRVDVDQALADELATAELALEQNDNYYPRAQQVATFDSASKKYLTRNQPARAHQTQPKRINVVNNRKEQVYSVRNNLAKAVPVGFNY